MATRGHKPNGFSSGHTADIGVGRQNRTEQLHQQDDLLRDRIREDQDEAILERTHIIKNLQGHGKNFKFVSSLNFVQLECLKSNLRELLGSIPRSRTISEEWALKRLNPKKLMTI
jgi:hypothetical protein